MSGAGPLRGVRVADFSWVGAGPFMTKVLADHGAEVIKVESRSRTDVIRTMPPFRDGLPGVDRSGYFANRNSSKRSICIDLRSDEGRELALQLIAESDMVVNNFTPGTMARLGLGYEHAKHVREDIIYLEMPMQGITGPHRGHRGYGLSIGAASGFYHLSGYPDAMPVGSGTNYPDHVPNPMHGAVALLAALRHRRVTGQGTYIEVAQLESTVNVIGPQIIAASMGLDTVRRGNTDATAAPHGVYPVSGDDRWIAIAATDDEQWSSLLEMLDAGWLSEVDGFRSLEARRRNAHELDMRLAELTRDHDGWVLADRLAAAGVPAAMVENARDVVDEDPQLKARGHWVTLDHPVMGPSLYDGTPYKLSRTPGRLRSAAPLLGVDTRAVASEILHLPDEQYTHLRSEGVLG